MALTLLVCCSVLPLLIEFVAGSKHGLSVADAYIVLRSVLTSVAVFMLAVLLPWSPSAMRQLMWIFLTVNAGVFLYAAYSLPDGGWNPISRLLYCNRGQRYHFPLYENPVSATMLSCFGFFLVPLSLALAATSKRSMSRQGALLLAMALITTLLTLGTRYIWIGLICTGWFVWSPLYGNTKILKTAAIVAALSIALLLAIGLFHISIDINADLLRRLRSFTSGLEILEDESIRVRLMLWGDAVRMVLKNPQGVGFSHFIQTSGKYSVFTGLWESANTHSEYLAIALGSGVGGVTAFIAVQIILFRTFMRGSAIQSRASTMGLAMIIGYAIAASCDTFSNNSGTICPNTIYFAALGLLLRLSQNDDKSWKENVTGHPLFSSGKWDYSGHMSESKAEVTDIDGEFPRNLMEFLDRFDTDEACFIYLSEVRWPNGFACPACSSHDGWSTARGTVYCRGCNRQTSITAGTILHNSRTPICKWFAAVWLLCTQKTGVSAKTLQRELKVGYKTAWLMLQDLRRATVRSERSLLKGAVEVDEIYVGGYESGVGGRQLVGKALVVIAVELDGKKVGRIRLRHVPDASGESLVGFITDNVEKGAKVHTDDWNGYNGTKAAGYRHRVTPIRGDEKRARRLFPHVHLVASLLKRWLGATYQGGVQKWHFQTYLDEYVFRFNRRRSKHVGKIFQRLIEEMVMLKTESDNEIIGIP